MNKLINKKHNGPIKVVTGVYRYGKSYLLFNLFKDYLLAEGTEVQLLGEFESVLNSLIRMKNVDVYVTGSNARFLSKDVITEFRGRGDEVHMHPLSFTEFMSVYSGPKQDGWNEYMLYGGLPPIMNISSPEEKINFLKSLFDETSVSISVNRRKLIL